MKKIIVSAALVFSTAVFSNLSAQIAPTGDKDLRDTNVKRRSGELDRVEREAKKNVKKSNTADAAKAEEDRLAAKYGEIKSDYEQIQLAQDAIIKAYQNSGKVDYAQIGKSALEIQDSAVRLNSNLFPAIENADASKEDRKETKPQEKTKNDVKASKSMRDLIVELDNAVGGFALNPMFRNLREVDATDSVKAKLDLEKIIELSKILAAEARKMDSGAR